MPSREFYFSSLAATTNREVASRHGCTHEWYRDQHGLECPECHGDLMEIAEIGNHPRLNNDEGDAVQALPQRDNDDSDPDEVDIEEFLNLHGFLHHRNTRVGMQQRRRDAVSGTFSNLVQNVGPYREQRQRSHPHVRPTSGTPGSATASLTTFLRWSPYAREDGSADLGLTRHRTFSNPRNAQQENGPGQGYSHGLSVILDLLRTPSAVHLNVRYTQGARRNAAPPATRDALSKLERRIVDTSFLNDCQTECPVCLDEIKFGEVAALLPCKHCFHEGCVVRWLKEHNTCPVCRTPIEVASDNSTERANGVDSTMAQATRHGNVGGRL